MIPLEVEYNTGSDNLDSIILVLAIAVLSSLIMFNKSRAEV